MAQDDHVVSIMADNVAHVRPVPDGMNEDEVRQQFWLERAERLNEKKPAAPEPGPKQEPEAPDPAKVKGPGECPYCGKHYKQRHLHVPHCDSGPGGKY